MADYTIKLSPLAHFLACDVRQIILHTTVFRDHGPMRGNQGFDVSDRIINPRLVSHFRQLGWKRLGTKPCCYISEFRVPRLYGLSTAHLILNTYKGIVEVVTVVPMHSIKFVPMCHEPISCAVVRLRDACQQFTWDLVLFGETLH